MGKTFSKMGIASSGSGAKMADAEFEYRYKNTKALRANLKSLMKSLNDNNTAIVSTPTRMIEVGESYMAVNACMNHGGAGGVSQSSNTRNAATALDNGEDFSAELPADPVSKNGVATSGGRTRINRELAKECYNSAQAFAEAMRKVKEHDYQAYRRRIEADIIKKAELLCTQADGTLAIGHSAQSAASKYAAACEKVDEIEKKSAKKGKEASKNENYSAAISKRTETEKLATEKKDSFHESYESLMAVAQDFSVQSIDLFMDCSVVYHKELVRVMDASGSPEKGRSGAREESHEPL